MKYMITWMDIDGRTHTRTIRESDLADTVTCMDERVAYGNCLGYMVTALGKEVTE